MHENMSAQEVFDWVATHLFAQGKQAKNEYDSCVYRTPEGLSCAAGCLIPDEEYDPQMEGITIDALVGVNSDRGNFKSPFLRNSPTFNNNIGLIRKLQGFHDNGDFWGSDDALREGLKNICNLFHLNSLKLSTLKFK